VVLFVPIVFHLFYLCLKFALTAVFFPGHYHFSAYFFQMLFQH